MAETRCPLSKDGKCFPECMFRLDPEDKIEDTPVGKFKHKMSSGVLNPAAFRGRINEVECMIMLAVRLAIPKLLSD